MCAHVSFQLSSSGMLFTAPKVISCLKFVPLRISSVRCCLPIVIPTPRWIFQQAVGCLFYVPSLRGSKTPNKLCLKEKKIDQKRHRCSMSLEVSKRGKGSTLSHCNSLQHIKHLWSQDEGKLIQIQSFLNPSSYYRFAKCKMCYLGLQKTSLKLHISIYKVVKRKCFKTNILTKIKL